MSSPAALPEHVGGTRRDTAEDASRTEEAAAFASMVEPSDVRHEQCP